jgi:hypothetical protein
MSNLLDLDIEFWFFTARLRSAWQFSVGMVRSGSVDFDGSR